MSEKEKTVYCGSGKTQNDKWMKATINVEKIKDHIEEFKGHKFVRININIKDEKDQYGKDVSISIDKWEPEQKEQVAKDSAEDSSDDLPF